MNNSITYSTFPDRVNVAIVAPIDKKTDSKYTVSNSRPGSLLNLRELHQKPHSMNNYISPYVSTYRKGYNFQHVLIRLLGEWRQHLDTNKAVEGVLWIY